MSENSNSEDQAPENKEERYRHFDKLLQEAHRDFIEHEDAYLKRNSDPAVRAARFNTFVMENPEYSVLRRDITPDICEQHLKRYHYVTVPIDKDPEPENAQQRYARLLVV